MIRPVKRTKFRHSRSESLFVLYSTFRALPKACDGFENDPDPPLSPSDLSGAKS